MGWLASHIGAVYWAVFTGAFFAVALWESARPLSAIAGVQRRWQANGLLFAISTAITALLFRLSPLAAAALGEQNPWGLFRSIPAGPAIPLGVLLLDLLHYGTHWTFHHAAWLWRIHSVHHSDRDFDVSTAVRFHPIEQLLTRGAVLAAIAALAVPLQAVVLSELLVVVSNFAVHANSVWPAGWETRINRFVVTPDAHRLHHSRRGSGQMSNYGQTLLIWDRLFHTYTPPTPGKPVETGLEESGDEDTLAMRHLLTYPFHSRL